MLDIDTRSIMADAKFYEGYSRWDEDRERYETWDEAVERVMNMHREYYKDKMTDELSAMIDEAEVLYKKKHVLGAQRALQFGGEQIIKHPLRMYNCCSSYADRDDFFGELFFTLLCGAGMGFSVQKHHVAKISEIAQRKGMAKTHVVEDTIEGWATALDVLMSSFFVGGGKHPEYESRRVYFDLSQVRPKGAMISGGFKAPGPEPLRKALDKIEYLIQGAVLANRTKLKPIEVYDICMHAADAVLAGGVRRCLPEGSKVHTKNGMIPIELVSIGDEVLTSSGEYRPVIEKFEQGEQNLVRISTQDSHIDCTPNHRIAVLTGVDQYDWKLASELEAGDRMIAPSVGIMGTSVSLPTFVYTKPAHSTTCKDITIPDVDEDIAWLLGLIQGDGYVRTTKSSGEVNISFGLHEFENAKRAQSILGRFGVNSCIKELSDNENMIVLQCNSKQLGAYFHSWLKQPNIQLKVPEFMWSATTEIKLAYICGLLDSDGSVKTRPIQVLVSVYENFVRELHILMASCGIQARIKVLSESGLKENWQPKYALALINTKSKEALKENSNSYKSDGTIISPSEKFTNSFPGEWIDNYPNNSTKAWAKTNAKLIPVTVISVDDLDQPQPTWDLGIDEIHEFFCEGYLVHNSATICMFSPEDEEMIKAKTGNWFAENPQRGRSNNSAVIVRNAADREQFSEIMTSIKEYGEPGFVFAESTEHTYNPCVSGDTLVTVKDHDVTVNGEVVAEGAVYQIPISGLVDLYSEFADDANPINNHLPLALTYNVDTEEMEYDHIMWAKMTRESTKVARVDIGDISIVSTPDHKFYTENRGWIEADQLTAEDQLILEAGKHIGATVELLDDEISVYDISVAKNHNFFANRVLIHNCVEIGKYPVWIDPETDEKISGIQGCNLSEGNGSECKTKEDFYRICRAGSILGTLQAGYTNFKFLSDASRKIFEREALIGVSMTGWMNSPDVLFDDETLREGAEIVKSVNKEVAAMIGINPAARTTCTKPSGNASVLLGTSSGIHGDHAPRYIRHVQINKEQEVAQLFKDTNPYMVEESVWSTNNSDYQIAFPIIAPEGSIFKKDLYGVELLKKVRQVQENWVEFGTDEDLCVDPTVRHNVSNTVQVAEDQWDEVEEYLFENRFSFAGVSFLSATGDKDFNQAPFTEVLTEEQIVEKYGRASMFASGLIVDSFYGFDNLWSATFAAQSSDEITGEQSDRAAEWIRRFRKFAETYFDGDMKKTEYCLKDVHLLYKWNKIQANFRPIDFKNNLRKKTYTDIGEYAAVACAGGACEI